MKHKNQWSIYECVMWSALKESRKNQQKKSGRLIFALLLNYVNNSSNEIRMLLKRCFFYNELSNVFPYSLAGFFPFASSFEMKFKQHRLCSFLLLWILVSFNSHTPHILFICWALLFVKKKLFHSEHNWIDIFI